MPSIVCRPICRTLARKHCKAGLGTCPHHEPSTAVRTTTPRHPCQPSRHHTHPTPHPSGAARIAASSLSSLVVRVRGVVVLDDEVESNPKHASGTGQSKNERWCGLNRHVPSTATTWLPPAHTAPSGHVEHSTSSSPAVRVKLPVGQRLQRATPFGWISPTAQSRIVTVASLNTSSAPRRHLS